MRRLLVVLMVLVVLVASCGKPPQKGAKKSEKKGGVPELVVVAVGDSLTEGLGVLPDAAYPATLEAALQKKGWAVRVVNAGISGETSAGALSRIDWVIAQLDPDLVILATGANDGLRRLPLKDMEKNIGQTVDRLRKADVPVILAGMRMFRNFGIAYASGFERVYPRIAKEKNLPLIGFLLEGVAGVPARNRPDGIHPNAAGYQEVVRRILPVVEGVLEERFPKKQLPV